MILVIDLMKMIFAAVIDVFNMHSKMLTDLFKPFIGVTLIRDCKQEPQINMSPLQGLIYQYQIHPYKHNIPSGFCVHNLCNQLKSV